MRKVEFASAGPHPNLHSNSILIAVKCTKIYWLYTFLRVKKLFWSFASRPKPSIAIGALVRSHPINSLLIATAHNCSTVFASWRQCARPFNGPMYTISWANQLIIQNGSLINTSVFFFTATVARSIYVKLTLPRILPNLPLSVGGMDPHLIHGFLSHLTRPPPHTTSRSPQPFFHNTCSLPTDRPTDRPTERRRNTIYINTRTLTLQSDVRGLIKITIDEKFTQV